MTACSTFFVFGRLLVVMFGSLFVIPWHNYSVIKLFPFNFFLLLYLEVLQSCLWSKHKETFNPSEYMLNNFHSDPIRAASICNEAVCYIFAYVSPKLYLKVLHYFYYCLNQFHFLFCFSVSIWITSAERVPKNWRSFQEGGSTLLFNECHNRVWMAWKFNLLVLLILK